MKSPGLFNYNVIYKRSTIIIHPDDFFVAFSLNTFYKSIHDFFHTPVDKKQVPIY